MNKIRWGILGCGRIAGKFASDLLLVKDAELVAVGSRSREKAASFAEKYPAPHVHGTYEELVSDPDVDVIYVASPHSHHHEHTLLCLRHNKAVLCEKAFAINARQAEEMITEAHNRKLFLMEALWSKFLPHFNMVGSMISEGKIGTIRSMQVNFGFKPVEPVPQRIFDPALGGGTLLDIGIYNVFFVLTFMGVPDRIQALMTPARTGVDEQLAVQFSYKNGGLAQMLSSFSSNLATEADIAGDNGRIRLLNRFYEPSTTIQYFPDKYDSLQTIPFSKEGGWGYQYQVRHVHECLRQGLIESPVMTHQNSLELMQVMDRVREIAGIRYESDL
ncbi:MAG TPA: Gfo/Idh/MocA family oxidoreductase [Chitinophagaceae bacterium]|nr:Gfo/Idh/MocA family oxidoreductase [Chitinophagaceae bacterium]